MKLKPRDLAMQLKSGKIPEAVLLYGVDQGLVAESMNLIRKATFNEDFVDFDLETFFGGGLDEERFLNACQSYPSLAPRRLILLKDADRITATTLKNITPYLKKPADTTLLVIMARTLEAKNPLRKLFDFSKTLWSIAFYALEVGEFRYWLQTYLQVDGFHIDPDAMHFLVERLMGGDTSNAAQELDKLKLFMGKQLHISLEDAQEMVGETSTHSSFALASAITGGDIQKATHIIDRLMQSGEEPLALLGTICQRIRKIAQAGELLNQGENPKTVAAKLRIFWKEQALFFNQVQTIHPKKLADGLMDCLEADRQLKNSKEVSNNHIMERLVMRLTIRFGGQASAFGRR